MSMCRNIIVFTIARPGHLYVWRNNIITASTAYAIEDWTVLINDHYEFTQMTDRGGSPSVGSAVDNRQRCRRSALSLYIINYYCRCVCTSSYRSTIHFLKCFFFFLTPLVISQNNVARAFIIHTIGSDKVHTHMHIISPGIRSMVTIILCLYI